MRPMKSNMKNHYAVPTVIVKCAHCNSNMYFRKKIFSVLVTFVNNILFPTTFIIEKKYLTAP